VIVHRCRKPLFPSVQEGVVILLAKGYGGQSSGAVRCDHSDDVALLAALQGDAEHSPLAISSFHDSDVVETITTFGDLFDIKLGGVTGDSRYFLLTEDRRRELGLPERICTPVISKASHLQTPAIYRTDWARMKDEGKRTWLFSPSPSDRHLKSVARYLRLKKEKGGCDRKAYKVSIRDPWFTVPLPERVDGFLSGMTRHGPWISWRSMRDLTATNTLYVLGCKDRLTRAEKFAWSISLLTSTARSAANRLGRRYADGLIKYEPGDLKQIPLPFPLSTRNSSDNYKAIIQLLLAGKERAAEARADALCSKGKDRR
jgi:hypothetical protein